MRSARLCLAAVCCLALARESAAYVDLAPTLGKIVSDAQQIAVVEVEKFQPERGLVILKKVADLKGELSDGALKQQLKSDNEPALDLAARAWGEAKGRGVLFVHEKAALLCLGRTWRQLHASEDGWWRRGSPRTDLPLAYYGGVAQLAEAVKEMAAGGTAIITTLPHGADMEGASFDLALNRASFPGLVQVQRIKANVRMPSVVAAVSNSPAYLIGPGGADVKDVPSLVEKLNASDPVVKAEAALLLGSLGKKADLAAGALQSHLTDASPTVRFAAAAAVLSIKATPEAEETLKAGLTSPELAVRREAARASSYTGEAGSKLTSELAALLKDEDILTRGAALEALGTLGPAAGAAADEVAQLLDEAALRVEAADTLGRFRAAARGALPKLAPLLESESSLEQWAAVRAMCQIGGDGAEPAARFIIKQMESDPSELYAYNSMLYLSLLGPTGKEAVPAVEKLRIKNPVLKPAALWAMEPETRFPWQSAGPFGGAFSDAGFARWIFEAYVHELSDRMGPMAAAVATRFIKGDAGEVPQWAFKICAADAARPLEIFMAALASDNVEHQQRGVVGLGYMGAAAAPAQEAVEHLLEKTESEQQRKLIEWCLREIK